MAANFAFNTQALTGKVAVVTGASGGLGIAICDSLRAAGASVVRVDINVDSNLRDIDNDVTIQCDIGDPRSVAQMANAIRTQFGRCDVLVNNAAISATAMGLETLPIERWDQIFQVNVRGSLLCAQALIPMMFDQQEGSVINIASIAAQSPTRFGAYGATKGAILALTHQMAIEWGPRGIRANSISPGMIRTPLSEVHYRDEATMLKRTSKIPMRRLGVPSDIGDLVCFLASDAATYINGQDITVDGGFLKASLSNLYQSE